MSWEIFRCEVDCATHPGRCVNSKLYRDQADELAKAGFLEAGYQTVSIDDCWEKRGPRSEGKPLAGDPSRFPEGMKSLGDYMVNINLPPLSPTHTNPPRPSLTSTVIARSGRKVRDLLG